MDSVLFIIIPIKKQKYVKKRFIQIIITKAAKFDYFLLIQVRTIEIIENPEYNILNSYFYY